MPSIQEMLTDSLRDILDAERQGVKALPRLAKAATSDELKQALLQHAEVTRGQVARLEQIFEMMGERARPKPCKAMQGLVEEAMEHISEHERGDELDAVLIASGQKVEHYEIAAYGTARAMAKSAGLKDVANLLQETLKEEGDTDKLLTKVALNVYREMVQQEGQDEQGVDEEEQTAGGRRGGRGSTASKKKASTRGADMSGGRSASKRSSGSSNGAGRSQSGRSGSRSGGSSRGGGKSSAGSQVTTDHDQIRQWAEERGAHPACVRGTGGKGDTGMIRLDFPGYSGGDSLEEISWDDFFSKFDEQGLALLYQDSTARGQKSNFNKLISRGTAELREEGGGSARRGTGKRGGGRSRSAGR